MKAINLSRKDEIELFLSPVGTDFIPCSKTLPQKEVSRVGH